MIFVSFPRRMYQIEVKAAAYYDHRGQDLKNDRQDETLTARMFVIGLLKKTILINFSSSLKLYEYKNTKI